MNSPRPGAWAGPASSTKAATSVWHGSASSAPTGGRVWVGPWSTAAGRCAHVTAGHLERGVRPGRRPGPRQRHGGGAARPHADRLRHRRPEEAAFSTPSGGAPSCGARATPSPTPAPTSPTCRPRRCATATSGSSRARRCGPRTPSGPTGASWCAAPTPRPPVTGGCRTCSSPWTSPASRSAPSGRSRARRSSTRCSSTGLAPPRISWWARSTTGGASPSPPCPSSGAWDCSVRSWVSARSSTTSSSSPPSAGAPAT